ncbi:hypothetical protein JYT24_00420 [Parvibaculum lavamentivorans]|nr:hypothetical protein [Parvibaculum lavamentivorans]
MKSIDDEIRAVLSAEEMEELERLTGEQGLVDMVAETFRSKMRVWIIIVWFYGFASFAGAVWTGMRFYEATDVREMAIWGGACLVLVLTLVLVKIWSWMEMNKTSVIREIKRLELQVAYLAKSLAKD